MKRQHGITMVLLVLTTVLRAQELTTPGRDISCEWDSLRSLAQDLKENGAHMESIQQLDKAHDLARTAADTDLLIRTHTEKGLTHHRAGDYERAWLHWSDALLPARTVQDMDAVAELNNLLGVAYYHLKQNDKALSHFQTSLELRQRIGTPYDVGVMLNNLGSYEMEFGSPSAALGYFRTSLAHWESIGMHSWRSVAYGHVGRCHELLGRIDSAKWYFEQALDLIPDDNSRSRRESRLHQYLGNWHLRHGDVHKAIEFCGRSLLAAEELNLYDQKIDMCLCISKANEKLGRYRPALEYYNRAMVLKDSIALDDQRRQIIFLQAGHEYKQKQLADSLRYQEEELKAEMEHERTLAGERNRRNTFVISTIGVLLIAGGLFQRLRYVRRSRELVLKERDRADQLLDNILPAQVAVELKTHGRSEPREFQQATILFTDFHGFTEITEQLSARELVSTIDECFTNFDRIIRKYGVEKIKTVGDCYMACGGVPDPSKGTPAEVVKAGLELQEFMARHAEERRATGLPFFTMRLGIHTGPVVAGIVGSDKFAYDIWGDTVNIAARMENTGRVGLVNISAHTHDLVNDDLQLAFVERGMIQTKGKGRLRMYFVEWSHKAAIRAAGSRAVSEV